jgi:hypothetical protein
MTDEEDRELALERLRLKEVRKRASRYRFSGRARRDDENYPVDSHGMQLEFPPERPVWSPHLRELLCGTRDSNSALQLLRGHEATILRKIYSTVTEGWAAAIQRVPPAYSAGRIRDPSGVLADALTMEEAESRDYEWRGGLAIPMMTVFVSAPYQFRAIGNRLADRLEIAFCPCGRVSFPAPNDINVNMMPFVMGLKSSLPAHLQPYYDLAIAKCPVSDEEIGKVCYLTVSEGNVQSSKTQRRGGLHTEAPGSFSSGAKFIPAWEHSWGMGMAYSSDELKGGLYMASNMDDTCEIFDALVNNSVGEVNYHGGMEHLRPFIGEGTTLLANELVWLTDRTPHEALPQFHEGYRQFFRLVTSNISLWFEDHSTLNPCVALPDYVTVIRGSKFPPKT